MLPKDFKEDEEISFLPSEDFLDLINEIIDEDLEENGREDLRLKFIESENELDN